jgi:hypothetical protein
MRAHPVDRPAELDVVRDSYDQVADNYAHMVVTTGMGDIRRPPWLKRRLTPSLKPWVSSAPSSTSAAAPAR